MKNQRLKVNESLEALKIFGPDNDYVFKLLPVVETSGHSVWLSSGGTRFAVVPSYYEAYGAFLSNRKWLPISPNFRVSKLPSDKVKVLKELFGSTGVQVMRNLAATAKDVLEADRLLLTNKPLGGPLAAKKSEKTKVKAAFPVTAANPVLRLFFYNNRPAAFPLLSLNGRLLKYGHRIAVLADDGVVYLPAPGVSSCLQPVNACIRISFDFPKGAVRVFLEGKDKDEELDANSFLIENCKTLEDLTNEMSIRRLASSAVCALIRKVTSNARVDLNTQAELQDLGALMKRYCKDTLWYTQAEIFVKNLQNR